MPKNDSAWFDDFVAQARVNNDMHSGSQPDYRAVTAAIARSLNDDALEMAIAKYGEQTPGWRGEAKPILVTERERRNRVRQKRIAWIAVATLIAAAAAVAAPFLAKP